MEASPAREDRGATVHPMPPAVDDPERADPASFRVPSAAFDDADHLSASPPDFTWWQARFRDPAVEVEYLTRELIPTLERRGMVAGVALSCMWFAMLVAELVASSGAPTAAVWLCTACALAALAIIGVARTPARLVAQLRVRLIDSCVLLSLVAQTVGLLIILSPPLSGAMFGERAEAVAGPQPGAPPPGWMPPASQPSYEGEALLHVLVLPVIVAIFLPVHPLRFGAFAALLAVLPTLLRAAVGLPATTAVSTRLTFVALLAVLFGAHLHLALLQRSQFHSTRSLRTAVVTVHREKSAMQQLERAEAEQAAQLRSTEAAQNARSRLIRMVMHDLRSPLLSVNNLATSLAAMPPSTQVGADEVQGSFRALGVCASLMECIVSDMLDFERIDSGSVVLVKAPFRLERLLADALASFAGIARAKGVLLSVEEVPDAISRAMFVGDARRLLQCLNNGLSNAVKFTERGGTVRLRTWLGVGDRDATAVSEGVWFKVHIAVIDSGAGIDKDELAALNSGSLFEQVGRGQLNGTGGTGLGLGIVRQLLALHDSSELALSSGGRNKGTSFELVLNLQGARVDPPSVAASDGHARTGLASGARTPDASESESLHALTSALLSHQSKRRPGKARAQTLASVPAKSSAIGGTSIAAAAEKVRMRPGAAASGSQLVQARRHGVMEDGESDTDSIYGGLGGLGTGTGGFGSPATTNRTEVRCLYVEDDKFLQLTIPGRIFLPLGVGYDSAEDGKRAVEMVLTEGRKYDCIVMDNQMPTMTGAQATRALRAAGFAGLIIGMTGDPAGCTDRDDFEAAGLDECCDKDTPGIERVIARIRALLPAAEQQQSAQPAQHAQQIELGDATEVDDDGVSFSSRAGTRD